MINWLTEQDRKLRKQSLIIVGSFGIVGIIGFIVWFYLGMGLY